MGAGNRAVQKGMAGELRAAAFLMENGYEVFMAIGSTRCDLIAILPGVETHDGLGRAGSADVMFRVEVKTAAPTSGGRYRIIDVKPRKFDMLLVVLPSGEVLMDPEEELVVRRVGKRHR